MYYFDLKLSMKPLCSFERISLQRSLGNKQANKADYIYLKHSVLESLRRRKAKKVFIYFWSCSMLFWVAGWVSHDYASSLSYDFNHPSHLVVTCFCFYHEHDSGLHLLLPSLPLPCPPFSSLPLLPCTPIQLSFPSLLSPLPIYPTSFCLLFSFFHLEVKRKW